MFRKIFLLLMELMVDHVSKRIQFDWIMLGVGTSYMVWVRVSPNCSDFDPTQVLDADDGQFPE